MGLIDKELAISLCREYAPEAYGGECEIALPLKVLKNMPTVRDGNVTYAKSRYDVIRNLSLDDLAICIDEGFGFNYPWCDINAFVNSECSERDCALCIMDWLKGGK